MMSTKSVCYNQNHLFKGVSGLVNIRFIMSNFGQITDNESFNSIAPIESLYPDLAQNTVSNATADALNPEPSVSTRIIYWYHPDYVGNVDLVTDLNQEAYEFYLYNPWGESLYHWESGSSSWNSPYRFNSKEFDAETGMHYYGARYHHPKLSVWMSVDPLSHRTRESYQYTGNNAISAIDPDGTKVKWNLDGIIVGFSMMFTKTGRENLKAMMADKEYTYQFVLRRAVGISYDEKTKEYGLIGGFQDVAADDPCTMLHVIYLGSRRAIRRTEKRHNKDISQIDSKYLHSVLRMMANGGARFERMEDYRENAYSNLNGKDKAWRRSFFKEYNFIPGGERGYKSYKPYKERILEFVARIAIHESTHGLVESGAWSDRDDDYRATQPSPSNESFPQLREKLWFEEHKGKRFKRWW